MFFRKYYLPWTVEDRFDREDAYQAWLQKRLKRFSDLRIFALILAAAALVLGYVLDQRPIMLVTIAPLILVLLLSHAIEKTEAACRP